MNNYQLIGFIGIMLINIAYIPQTIKVCRTKNVEGLSISFFFILFVGLFLLQVYSVSVWDIVYMVSNFVAMFNVATLLVLIIMYRKDES